MVSYEESRKKRVEENKKRMEELNLHKLSQSLSLTKKMKNNNHSLPKKVRSRSSDFAVRRSGRTADKPPPNYKEFGMEPFLGRSRVYSSRSRDPKDDFIASAEDRADSIERAHLLQSSLPSQFPTFVKPMLHSHVAGGFWLSLPLRFCKAHMSTDKDVTVTLVDEGEHQWEANYLAYKNGLSGGWRTFSLDHHLRDGDALIFQLTQENTFKVHIIRVESIEHQQDKGDDGSLESADATESRARKGTKRN